GFGLRLPAGRISSWRAAHCTSGGAVFAPGGVQTSRDRLDRLPRLPDPRRGRGLASLHASRHGPTTQRARLPETRRRLLDARDARRSRRSVSIARYDPLARRTACPFAHITTRVPH